ncbi:MAG: thermonuclease family protein [Pyrodictiaceae archaeon]
MAQYCASMAVVLLAVYTLLSLSSPIHVGPDIDAIAVVTRVVDGDTIYAKAVLFLDKHVRELVLSEWGMVFKVRLADINAPELNTQAGIEAKKFLESLIPPGTLVYLDVDDLYVFGRYGRVIAVVYKPINTTVLLNVNLLLVKKGYARPVDYPNEFKPYTWSLYVSPPELARFNETSQPYIMVHTVATTLTASTATSLQETVTATKTMKASSLEHQLPYGGYITIAFIAFALGLAIALLARRQ